MIKLHDGNWLLNGSDNIANECCCGTTVSACSTETCGGTNNPSMQLTLFDADYVGGDMFWCGETWTQVEIQAGVTKCVCPTRYVLTTTGASLYERWQYDTTSINYLDMYRRANTNNIYHHGYLLVQMNSGTITLFSSISNSFGSNGTIGGSEIFNPPSVMFDTTISVNNYRLNDRYFGCFAAGGITYTWMRGANWP